MVQLLGGWGLSGRVAGRAARRGEHVTRPGSHCPVAELLAGAACAPLPHAGQQLRLHQTAVNQLHSAPAPLLRPPTPIPTPPTSHTHDCSWTASDLRLDTPRGAARRGMQARPRPSVSCLLTPCLAACLSTALQADIAAPCRTPWTADEVFRHAAARFIVPEALIPYTGQDGGACTAPSEAPPGAVRAYSPHGFVRVGDGAAALMDAVASQG